MQNQIPTFPIPLRSGEPEPIIDLQKLLDEVYVRAIFDLAIDYSQPIKPLLSSEKEAWIKNILEK